VLLRAGKWAEVLGFKIEISRDIGEDLEQAVRV